MQDGRYVAREGQERIKIKENTRGIDDDHLNPRPLVPPQKGIGRPLVRVQLAPATPTKKNSPPSTPLSPAVTSAEASSRISSPRSLASIDAMDEEARWFSKENMQAVSI
jgi:hypothetical protein